MYINESECNGIEMIKKTSCYVVLRALWKIDVYLISTLVNKSLYYY